MSTLMESLILPSSHLKVPQEDLSRLTSISLLRCSKIANVSLMTLLKDIICHILMAKATWIMISIIKSARAIHL